MARITVVFLQSRTHGSTTVPRVQCELRTVHTYEYHCRSILSDSGTRPNGRMQGMMALQPKTIVRHRQPPSLRSRRRHKKGKGQTQRTVSLALDASTGHRRSNKTHWPRHPPPLHLCIHVPTPLPARCPPTPPTTRNRPATPRPADWPPEVGNPRVGARPSPAVPRLA